MKTDLSKNKKWVRGGLRTWGYLAKRNPNDKVFKNNLNIFIGWAKKLNINTNKYESPRV